MTEATPELTGAEALAEIEKDDHRRAFDALKEEQRKTLAVKDRAKKQQARFDKAVALAVSSRPAVEEWYAYPGPLAMSEVQEALGLKPDDLLALMKRFRKKVSS
jgi:hypothetical protein